MNLFLKLIVCFFKFNGLENDNIDIEIKKMLKLIIVKIKKIGIFIDNVDWERYVDEYLIELLVKNVDILIGIDIMEELKYYIMCDKIGNKSNLEKCFDYLMMFLRLVIFR